MTICKALALTKGRKWAVFFMVGSLTHVGVLLEALRFWAESRCSGEFSSLSILFGNLKRQIGCQSQDVIRCSCCECAFIERAVPDVIPNLVLWLAAERCLKTENSSNK